MKSTVLLNAVQTALAKTSEKARNVPNLCQIAGASGFAPLRLAALNAVFFPLCPGEIRPAQRLENAFSKMPFLGRVLKVLIA